MFQVSESVSPSTRVAEAMPSLHRPTTESQPTGKPLSHGTFAGMWADASGCHSYCCSQISCGPVVRAHSARQRTVIPARSKLADVLEARGLLR